jgi:D-lyxose ketol-isomerase
MRRSEINGALKASLDELNKYSISLPPFAHWSADEWKNAGPEKKRVKLNGLGWDITDFGQGDFPACGAVMFVLRNGNHTNPSLGTPYAEKLIMFTPGQRLPLHFHWSKTEDIINRAGGVMEIQLYNAKDDDSVDYDSPVTAYCDGIERVVKPGEVLRFHPGESITLTPRLYHKFWAARDAGYLICGEVSAVNDDNTDNFFAEPVSRFSDIEEDEAPFRLLGNER